MSAPKRELRLRDVLTTETEQRVSDREIRAYWGHGLGSRRVRVTRGVDGCFPEVWFYGSTDDTDRSRDYWQGIGQRSDVVAEILRDRRALAKAEEVQS